MDRYGVIFPFEPYETQRKYVESVGEALTKRQHALLESPTGTGKTLSLLCSTLAWLQKNAGSGTVIYYTSRTHMQLAQAAKEMKRTAYSKIPSVVIGSRAQMCLNDDVKNQQGDHLLNRACRNAIARNACSYYSHYDNKQRLIDCNSVLDIEDLKAFGREHQCCPYYVSKKIAETKASLVFMPYNYLLDSSLRKNFELRIKDSIVIFDEAHNLDGVLKDVVSGCFTQSCLSKIEESCLKLPSKLSECLMRQRFGLSRNDSQPRSQAITDEVPQKKSRKPDKEKEQKVNPIEELAEKLSVDQLQRVNQCVKLLKTEIQSHLNLDVTCGIEKVFRAMELAGVDYTTSHQLITTLESMASFWSLGGVMSPNVVAQYVSSTTNLSNVISLLYPEECLSLTRQAQQQKSLDEYYTVYLKGIYEPSRVLQKGNLKDWELNLWCLHPAIGMKRVLDPNSFQKPRSIILTSGTLAPMRPWERDLEIDFKIMKEFEHIISRDQLKVSIIGQSLNCYSLDSHFDALKKDEYPLELGRTLLILFKLLPYGTLVFFTSYSHMNRVVKYWKEKSRIWRDMRAISSLYMEDKSLSNFQSDFNSYKNVLGSSTGHSSSAIRRAVFFGVCRGRLSEGVNLEGNHCRTVIMTGLPFPSLTDARIRATRFFHEKRGDTHGSIWYSQQMFRALNQTLGRVIRSKSDYGMLILCDPRFKRFKYSLSEWTRDFFPSEETRMDSIESDIKEFFSKHDVHIRESASEDLGAFEIGISRPNNRSRLSNLSPFSEDSQVTSSSSCNRNLNSQNSQTNIRSAKERRDAMMAGYRVSQDEYDRIKRARVQNHDPKSQNQEAPQKTTADVIETLCSEGSGAPREAQPQRLQTDDDISGQPFTSTPRSGLSHAHIEPKSLNIFKSKKTKNPFSREQKNTQSLPVSPHNSSSVHDYSILKEYTDNKGPASYRCCICLNAAKNPHSTNCSCARVGCFKCLRILSNSNCGKCGTPLLKKNFRQILFKSAFFSKERLPVIEPILNRK